METIRERRRNKQQREVGTTASLVFLCRVLCMICIELFETLHVFRLEKYRPQKLQDVVGNKLAIQRLGMFAKQGNLPNIVISVS